MKEGYVLRIVVNCPYCDVPVEYDELGYFIEGSLFGRYKYTRIVFNCLSCKEEFYIGVA